MRNIVQGVASPFLAAWNRLPQPKTAVPSCLLLIGCSLIVIVLAGCGKGGGPERVVVSGSVTYNGKPIPDGTIRFIPTATSEAPTTGASILGGKYTADARGGVPVGTHVVQIEAYCTRGQTPPTDGSITPPPKRFEIRDQYLPDKFNATSDLQIVIPSRSRPTEENFDLKD